MDNYIDNDETQKYGPDLRTNVARAFADATPPVAAIVAWIIEGQKSADETFADAMHKARQASSGASSAADEKEPAVVDARKLMTGFHKHLESKLDLGEWSGDLTLFFPKGRTGLSKHAGPLATSIDVALRALHEDATVPEHAKFTAKLKRAHKDLSALIGATSDATHGARKGLSEQSAEKEAWLREYRSNALLVEGLLQKAGRLDELNGIIPHLSAPGGRKTGDADESNTDKKPVTPKPDA